MHASETCSFGSSLELVFFWRMWTDPIRLEILNLLPQKACYKLVQLKKDNLKRELLSGEHFSFGGYLAFAAPA